MVATAYGSMRTRTEDFFEEISLRLVNKIRNIFKELSIGGGGVFYNLKFTNIHDTHDFRSSGADAGSLVATPPPFGRRSWFVVDTGQKLHLV